VAVRTLVVAAFVSSVVVLASTRDAKAMGAIVSSPPGAAQTTSVRVAVASAGTRTSRWVSLHVHGGAASFAWIVPARPGAFVDLASDAWLESLEDATAPRVVPPWAPPPAACSPASGVDVAGDTAHVATTSPDAIATAADEAALASTLAAWSLALPSDLAPLVENAVARGDSFLVLRFGAATADVDTRTLRLVDSGPPTLDLELTRATSPVAITGYALTSGPATFGSAPPLALDPSLLLWNPGGGSTYAGVTESLLASHAGAWLADATGHDPIFAGEAIPSGGDVPALSQSYFTRASAYGDASEASSACASAASSWAASPSPVALACPRASVGRVGSSAGPPCQETVAPGELAPDGFRCGGIADDLALALSGLAPGGAWVSRARSVTAPDAPGSDVAVAAGGVATPAEVGPVFTCAGYGGACGQGAAPTGGSPGTSSTGSSSGEPSPDPGATAAGAVAGAALDNSDGCGGSSDSSSSDGCGGSTSTDTGGESSSSSSESSSSSDSCSGDSSNSSSNCAIRGTAPSGMRGRSPMSRAFMLLVAMAFLLRRRGHTARA
jgi:hypothetical protein